MKEKEEKKIKSSDVKSVKTELNEIKDLLQRTQADFINYKRRNEEDRVNFARFASADIIEQILPVLDNFVLAARHVPKELEGNNWVTGVQAVEKQLEQILAANGLTKIETEGNEFDHEIHEAIGQVHEKEIPNNVIVKEEAPGYVLNGKLLRPAKVIVNSK